MQNRENAQIALNYSDKPYWKAINALLIFINPDTFNLLVIIDYHAPITLDEIYKVNKDDGYKIKNIEANLALLEKAKMIYYNKGNYYLWNDNVINMNHALKAIGKHAVINDLHTVEKLLKRNI